MIIKKKNSKFLSIFLINIMLIIFFLKKINYLYNHYFFFVQTLYDEYYLFFKINVYFNFAQNL